MIRIDPKLMMYLVVLPLLGAQQIRPQTEPQFAAPDASSSVTIPKDTRIRLIAIETVSSATAKRGDSVRFALAEDVIISGVKVISAGTPVVGTVVNVKRGVPKHREGFLRIRLSRLTIKPGTEAKLTASDPQYRPTPGQALHERTRNIFENVGGGVTCAALLPICAGLELSMGNDWRPDGRDALLPTCYPIDRWISAALTVQPAELPPTAYKFDKDTLPMSQLCGKDLKIDWRVSDLQMLDLE